MMRGGSIRTAHLEKTAIERLDGDVMGLVMPIAFLGAGELICQSHHHVRLK